MTSLRERVESLESRLQALEGVNRLRRSGAAREVEPSNPSSPLEAGDSSDSGRAVESRVAALTQKVEELGNVLAARGLLPPDANAVEDAEARILDASATPMDKLMALRLLRSADARSDDVVRSMIEVYKSAEEARVRADIFRQLEGVTVPELKDTLLQAVAEEAAVDVREEAAETLASYLPAEDVRRWLEYLLENDPEETVREQAARSLQVAGER